MAFNRRRIFLLHNYNFVFSLSPWCHNNNSYVSNLLTATGWILQYKSFMKRMDSVSVTITLARPPPIRFCCSNCSVCVYVCVWLIFSASVSFFGAGERDISLYTERWNCTHNECVLWFPLSTPMNNAINIQRFVVVFGCGDFNCFPIHSSIYSRNTLHSVKCGITSYFPSTENDENSWEK